MQYTKILGVVLVAISLIFVFVLFSFAGRISEANQASCGCVPSTCPMAQGLPIEIYLGIIATVILGISGLFLVVKTRQLEGESLKKQRELNERVRLLAGEERRIYEIIFNSEGIIFQSDLVEQSELPKAKVSRILDKLEGKKLVERKRRGLSNIGLLKKP